MQAVYTQTGEKIELASLGKRIAAFTVDAMLFLTLIATIDYLTYSSNEEAYFFKPERMLDICLGWLYFAGMETCACQATLGKYLIGLRITASTGGRISFMKATIRYFTKPVSVAIVVMRFIFGASKISRRTFHDKLADSVVIAR